MIQLLQKKVDDIEQNQSTPINPNEAAIMQERIQKLNDWINDLDDSDYCTDEEEEEVKDEYQFL